MAITFDHATNLIHMTSPHTVTLEIQDLADAISTEEASERGRMYPQIADMNGKAAIGVSFVSGIILQLYSPWQIKFPTGAKPTVSGGALIGGLSDVPIVQDTDVHVNRITPVDGVIAEISGGSGLDPGQDTKLTTIFAQMMEVWRLAGLDISNPMTVTQTSRQVADIDLAITGDGETTTTVTRQ